MSSAKYSRFSLRHLYTAPFGYIYQDPPAFLVLTIYPPLCTNLVPTLCTKINTKIYQKQVKTYQNISKSISINSGPNGPKSFSPQKILTPFIKTFFSDLWTRPVWANVIYIQNPLFSFQSVKSNAKLVQRPFQTNF